MTKDDGTIRKFETGATRDTADGKLDYEGFLSPSVLREYGRYMHRCRLQSDGALRSSDNWQKGMPMDEYMKSEWRHHMTLWELHRDPDTIPRAAKIEAAMGIMFNVMGYVHELLKTRQ